MSSTPETQLSTQIVASMEDGDKQSRHTKKPSNRPAMQIYKPPGLRSGGSSNDGGASSAAGGVTLGATSPTSPGTRTQTSFTISSQQQNKKSSRDLEENNNYRSTTMSSDRDASSRFSESSHSQNSQRLKRTESSISSESAVSQKSSGSGSGRGGGNASSGRETGAPAVEKRSKQPTPPKKEPKKKIMTEREILDAAAGLRALRIGGNTTEIEDWIASAFVADDLAESVGSTLCQHAIEGGGGRVVAKLCGSLRDAPSAYALYKGLMSSVSQYFECRDRLRADHFRMWISFLSFVADLYANIGGGKDGELVNFVFQVFDYLLRAPILETLKIEELESLISALLSVGYDLERECPDQLSLLKDLIRDAFIDVSEPWARKMILLLLELGASGWKLPAEANEYYFQQTTN
ncbi:hypothetical protein Y032_0003g1169 [Ancylostoma ceylanicum]|uniref:MIF4G domain-containing protein n=2 Tax=Ancylostoma ceylanicum TaxID=53326 RepID=A0A016VW73_9BILA|nr:hypothetical protein Y032_0003g1169 [Ancylostoma ceylanicum]